MLTKAALARLIAAMEGLTCQFDLLPEQPGHIRRAKIGRTLDRETNVKWYTPRAATGPELPADERGDPQFPTASFRRLLILLTSVGLASLCLDGCNGQILLHYTETAVCVTEHDVVTANVYFTVTSVNNLPSPYGWTLSSSQFGMARLPASNFQAYPIQTNLASGAPICPSKSGNPCLPAGTPLPNTTVTIPAMTNVTGPSNSSNGLNLLVGFNVGQRTQPDASDIASQQWLLVYTGQSLQTVNDGGPGVYHGTCPVGSPAG
jgi:hypothetical protein